jgi:predicted nucleotidyltransferase
MGSDIGCVSGKMYAFGSPRATALGSSDCFDNSAGSLFVPGTPLARPAVGRGFHAASRVGQRVDFLPFLGYLEAAMRTIPFPSGDTAMNVGGIA